MLSKQLLHLDIVNSIDSTPVVVLNDFLNIALIQVRWSNDEVNRCQNDEVAVLDSRVSFVFYLAEDIETSG